MLHACFEYKASSKSPLSLNIAEPGPAGEKTPETPNIPLVVMHSWSSEHCDGGVDKEAAASMAIGFLHNLRKRDLS
jgi:hypothetical protein